MIPTDTLHDDFREGGSFFVGLGVAILAALIIAALAGWWYTRTGPEREENYVHARAELELRAEDQLRSEEVYRLSNVFAGVNPALTLGERYEIAEAVNRWAAARGLDADLVAAVVIVESTADPHARSASGARGVMQVMPGWAADGDDLFNVDTNVRLGTAILADNIARWGLEEGVARYFWGMKTPDGTYLAKVMKVKEGLSNG